jgi:hypothetical protein
MVLFEPELWRRRAQTRYKRALAKAKKAKKKQKLLESYVRDCTQIINLEKLIGWCNSHKITVNFCKLEAGIFYPQENLVKISGRLSPESQLFCLLHECGHYLVGSREKHQRYGMGYQQEDPNIIRTFHHKCDIVEEELEAWHRGAKLATRLGIDVDKSRFDKSRTTCIRTYMKWAIK